MKQISAKVNNTIAREPSDPHVVLPFHPLRFLPFPTLLDAFLAPHHTTPLYPLTCVSSALSCID
jgi:hypothetical protein